MVVGTLNNAGSVIMEIADLSDMVLKARVDESNIVSVKDNQQAKVFVNAYGEREFKGMVERVELQRKLDRDCDGVLRGVDPGPAGEGGDAALGADGQHGHHGGDDAGCAGGAEPGRGGPEDR